MTPGKAKVPPEKGWSQVAKSKLPLHHSLNPDKIATDLANGDLRLNPHMKAEMPNTLRKASVMIPFIERESGTSVLLTQRSDALKDHPGQIAFPGGKHEPEDPSPWHAAKRELMEEVGINPGLPEPLGALPPYHTRSGFQIWPFVCGLPAEVQTKPQVSEVADIFEVPVSFLFDDKNLAWQTREWQGKPVYFVAMNYHEDNGKERHIWGVTAGIIMSLRSYLLDTPLPKKD